LMQRDEDRCRSIMYSQPSFAVIAASKLTTFLLFFSREIERAIFRSGPWPDTNFRTARPARAGSRASPQGSLFSFFFPTP
jgi:hypothetical protein